MANRQQGYGFTKETADKMNSKYSTENESQVVAWISAIVHDRPSGSGRQV